MQIQNVEAAAIIRSQAGLTLAEGFPQNLASTVQPVIDMTPDSHVVADCASVAATASAASNNIVTNADLNRDRYITGVTLSILKDATCDVATGAVTLSAVLDGDSTSTALLSLPVLTTTAQSDRISLALVRPVKLKKGAAVALGQGTFTAGNFIRHAQVYYYDIFPTAT